MTSATLINVFEVRPERDEEFLRLWERANDLLQQDAGYSSTRLHRATRPDAKYRFINVAEIGSVERWRAVVSSPEFAELSAQMGEFVPAPALYTVIREHHLTGVDH